MREAITHANSGIDQVLLSLISQLSERKQIELCGYVRHIIEEEANALPRPKGSHGVPIAPEPPATAHKAG